MLAIRDLHYRYPGSARAALDGVSFDAAPGEVLGLLGPNGAGKTTLIAHVAGLVAPQRGDIRVAGEPLSALRRRDATRIAVAPQEYAFYPSLTVLENLNCFAACARLSGGDARARVGAAVAFAQLERFRHLAAQALSGGLKRRLNLAIALLAQPDIILFDEPTAGVDPQSRAFLLDAVRALARGGTTVIYTSHYMDEIEAIADHVVIIDHGKVLRDGPLQALLAEGARRMSLRVDNMPEARHGEVFASLGAWHRQGPEIVIDLHEQVSPGAVLAAVESSGARVLASSFGRYNLEQLFMALTERSLRDE